jgi:hypothetical protein
VVHRTLPAPTAPPPPSVPGETRLFEPEGPSGGCASGECLEPETPAAPGQAFLPGRWAKAVEAVTAASARHGKSLAFGRLVKLAEGEVELYFPPQAAFHRATATGAARALIEKALSDFFQAPMKIRVSDKAPELLPPSLGELEAQGKANRERSIEDKVRSHPAVRSVLRALGGDLEHVLVLEAESAPPNVDVPGDLEEK